MPKGHHHAMTDPAKTPSIVGVGTTAFGDLYRNRDPQRTHFELAQDAFHAALEDCGLRKDEIDAVLLARVTSYLTFGADNGLRDIRYVNYQGSGGSQSGVAVFEAANLIRSGAAKVIACVYGNHGRSIRMNYGGVALPTSRYANPYGMTSNGAYYGMMFRRHQHAFSTSADALGHIATSCRANAVDNPNAVMRKPMDMDDYFALPMVSEPMRLLDYCMVNDGGVAHIVTSLERARDLKKAPVRILSSAVSGVMDYFFSAEDCWFDALDRVRGDLFAPAGLTPRRRRCGQYLRQLHAGRAVLDRRHRHLPARRRRRLAGRRASSLRRRAADQSHRRPSFGELHVGLGADSGIGAASAWRGRHPAGTRLRDGARRHLLAGLLGRTLRVVRIAMTATHTGPLPEPSPIDAPYWGSGANGVLRMQTCGACGHVQFPPGRRCAPCGSPDLAWTPLSGTGRVWSWLRFHKPYFPGILVPYIVLRVQLDEGPFLMTNLVDCGDREPAIDDRVRVVFQQAGDIWLPQFTFADEAVT